MPQYIYYQWKQYPVPIQYSLPKWINAAEAGVLIDGSADVDDLLSFVPEWIRKWFVSVYETSTSIKFHKIKDLPENAKPYEKTLFNELFSDKKININQIRLDVLDYCFKMGRIKDPFWFHKSIGWKIFLIIFFLLFACLSFSAGLIFSSLLSIWFAIFICASPVVVWESLLQKRKISTEAKSYTKLTPKWKLLEVDLLWYKQYLKKIKITTKTDIIDDGTLSHRMSLNVNDWGNIIDCIKAYKINTYEDNYDDLFLREFYDRYEKYRNTQKITNQ